MDLIDIFFIIILCIIFYSICINLIKNINSYTIKNSNIVGGNVNNQNAKNKFKNRFANVLKLFNDFNKDKSNCYGIVTEFDHNNKWLNNIKKNNINFLQSSADYKTSNVIISNNKMKIDNIDLTKFPNLAKSSIILTKLNDNLLLAGIHFPASIKDPINDYKKYFDEINTLIQQYKLKNKQLIFAGDFNQFVSKFELNVPNYKIISSNRQTGFSSSNEKIDRNIDVLAIPNVLSASFVKFLGTSENITNKIEKLPYGNNNKIINDMKMKKGCLFDFIDGELSDHSFPIYKIDINKHNKDKIYILCLSQLGDKRLMNTAYWTECKCTLHPTIPLNNMSKNDCIKDNIIWKMHEKYMSNKNAEILSKIKNSIENKYI